MPQLFSALRVLGRHTVMKSALDTRFVPVSFEDAGDEKRMQIPDVLRTSVTAIRGRDGIGHAVLSNLYNVIHGATHVLARGDTFCTDERLGFDTRRTHGLFSEFSWSGRN